MKFKKVLLYLTILAGSLFFGGCDYPFPQYYGDNAEHVYGSSSDNSETLAESGETEEQLCGTGELTVHFIDVGQGDCTFIELSNGETMLIDAGEASESDIVVAYIFSQGYDTVDYVIATHPHDDHIGGMSEVLNNFIVNDFYFTEAVSDSVSYEKMLAAISDNGVTAHYVSAGDIIVNEGVLSAEVAAPKTIECDNLNDTSIVIKLTYKDNVFLFTGDAEKYEEDNIWTNIKCDVLKVGHHGSSTSTSANFLKKTEPSYAVISAGLLNSYGHPTEKTLKALAEREIKTFRTDLQGTIIFNSDGVNITVNKDPAEYAAGSGEAPSASESGEYSGNYVLNTNSKKIHYPDCDSVSTIKEKNKKYTDDFDAAISQGYTPCGACKPSGNAGGG